MSFITLKCLQKKCEISISPAKNARLTVSFWKSRFWEGINLWNTFTGLRSLPPSPPQPPPHHIPPDIHPPHKFLLQFFPTHGCKALWFFVFAIPPHLPCSSWSSIRRSRPKTWTAPPSYPRYKLLLNHKRQRSKTSFKRHSSQQPSC